MNALPVKFYDNVFGRFDVSSFSIFGCLSGPFGSLSLEYYENHTVYALAIENGQIRNPDLLCYFTTLERRRKIYPEKSKMRKLGGFQVTVRDDGESEEDSSTVCKLPYFTNNTSIYLYLASSKISKASEKLIDSMRILGYLGLEVPITSQIQGVLEKIVQKKKLGRIVFKNDHQFDESSTRVVLDLLKQEQFDLACFSRGCSFPLKDLIAEWKESSHQMIGKRVYFTAKLEDEIGSEFQQCTEEDMSLLRTYYPPESYYFQSKYLVLKCQISNAMYVRLGEWNSRILFA